MKWRSIVMIWILILMISLVTIKQLYLAQRIFLTAILSKMRGSSLVQAVLPMSELMAQIRMFFLMVRKLMI